MIKGALNLPRISCLELEQENIENILKDISRAKAVVTFYETVKGEYKFLFTDLGENEYALLLMQIHRNVEVFDFFKLIIITIEEMRKDFAKTLEFTNKAVEYLKLKRQSK